MSSTFLSLVNRVNRKVNEVELTSSNFASAAGFYSTAKDAVNDSISRINHMQFKWPFNYSLETQALTAGTMRYAYPATAKWIDFETFRIQRDATFGNETKHLEHMRYEEYLDKHVDDEYNTTDTGIRTIPRRVARTPNQEIIVWPSPDEAYNLDFEAYVLPVALSEHGDTTTIPANYDHVIQEGAMAYVYNFKRDVELASKSTDDFGEMVDEMKSVYINRYDEIRDGRVNFGGGVTTRRYVRVV